MRVHARWLFAEIRWLVESAGYWIRPYDMLADARRWRWKPRQRCGWSYGFGRRVNDQSGPGRQRKVTAMEND